MINNSIGSYADLWREPLSVRSEQTEQKGSRMSGKNTRGPWLANPREARPGETIGGGFFVFRRGRTTGRVRASQWPFEHDTLDAAVAQAQTHAVNEAQRFDVVQVVYSVDPPEAVPEAAPQADPA